MAFEPNIPPIQAHICVHGGDAAIAFYEAGFGAKCTFKQMAEDGVRVLHANLAINGAEFMLHDEFPEFDPSVRSPNTVGGASVAININLSAAGAVDAIIAQAEAAGATVINAPQDQFWGARYGRIRDPQGHVWAFNAPLKSGSQTA